MNDFFPSIYGNDDLRSRLGTSVIQGRFPHALLIEGKEGSGKKTFATLLSAALCCEKKNADALPCTECPACKKILNRLCVDVTYVDREDRATIGIEKIRDMRADMHLSSTEMQNKIYIVDRAEALTPEAQNALLVSIEEPPPHVFVFLLATRSDTVLPTIKSRVQTVKMQSFSAIELERYLIAASPAARKLKDEDDRTFQTVLLAADGTIGRALSLLDSKATASLMQEREITDSILNALTAKASYSSLSKRLALLPTKRQELLFALTELTKALRDLLVLKRDEEAELIYHTDREGAKEVAESLSILYLLELYSAVSDAEFACTFNANISSLLSSLPNDLYTRRFV